MDDGIVEIKLLPGWSPSSVQAELKSALAKAQLLQAGIAYWTVGDILFGDALPRTLRDDSGFLCVDLHPPTDIDALSTLVRKGAHIYLFSHDITSPDMGRKEPPHLLHTKMLLFWSRDQTLELWVGSHNWTNRAILGLNVEASVVIRARCWSTIFSDAAQYLQKIKQICEPFDLSKIDDYKRAQGEMIRTKPVIYLEARAASTLHGITVGLFGTDDKDFRELRTVQRDIHISVLDSDSEQEFIYPATILQVGLLSAADPAAAGIGFSSRRYAFRPGRKLPVLLPEGPIGQDVLSVARYFATISLQRADASLVADPPPAKSAGWVNTSPQDSPILQRLTSGDVAQLFRAEAPQPRRPWFDVEGLRSEDDDSRALTLSERRSLPEQRLVSRRILRRKK